jgi:hypothetical protein
MHQTNRPCPRNKLRGTAYLPVSAVGTQISFQAPGLACQPENDEDDLRRFDTGTIRNNDFGKRLNVFCPLQGALNPNDAFRVTEARLTYSDFSNDESVTCNVVMRDSFGGLSVTESKNSCLANPAEGCTNSIGSDRLIGTLRWSGSELFSGGTFMIPSVSWHFSCELPHLRSTGACTVRHYSVTIDTETGE